MQVIVGIFSAVLHIQVEYETWHMKSFSNTMVFRLMGLFDFFNFML